MDMVAINNEISTLLPSNQTLIVIALVSIGVALLYVSPKPPRGSNGGSQ